MVGWDLGGEGPLAKHTLWGHGDRVDDVPFSPDGTPLATAGWDGTARLWKMSTGEEVRCSPATSVVC